MASYWNPDMEKLDQKSIAELQGRKLRAMVRDRLFRHHPYYSPLLRSSGVDVHDITGIDDLSRVPFTSHEDLAADP
jgi:phenylacetate-CoA ligase